MYFLGEILSDLSPGQVTSFDLLYFSYGNCPGICNIFYLALCSSLSIIAFISCVLLAKGPLMCKLIWYLFERIWTYYKDCLHNFWVELQVDLFQFNWLIQSGCKFGFVIHIYLPIGFDLCGVKSTFIDISSISIFNYT